MGPLTVVVAHRENASRKQCTRLLRPEKRIRVVAEARSGLEAVAITARLRPRILLLDLNLAWINGFGLLPVLRQKSPETRVVLVTSRASDSRILEALSHGALGYLEKRALPTFLAKAVLAVDAGEAWVPRKMVARLVDRLAHLTLRVRIPDSRPTGVRWTKVQ